MPRVLNRHTDVIPAGAVYVGRPTKWGNPYIKGPRKDLIANYQKYIQFKIQDKQLDIEELRGKDLACWCHTWDGTGTNPRYCHADILLELANEVQA